MHKRISHTMWNFAWCAKFFGCFLWFRMVCEISYSVRNCLSLSPALSPAAVFPLDFACYAKFSHSHAKMLVIGFLPLVFFLVSLIGLVKGYEMLQSLDSSCIWASTCIAMDFTKFSLILGLFQWSNSYQKHQNLPNLISNPC